MTPPRRKRRRGGAPRSRALAPPSWNHGGEAARLRRDLRPYVLVSPCRLPTMTERELAEADQRSWAAEMRRRMA